MRQDFARQAEVLDEVFRFVDRFAAEARLGENARLDLGLIAEELFTNQIRHAGPGGEWISIELEMVPEGVRFMLEDEDVEDFDPTLAPAPDITLPAGERTPGGLGLHFIRCIARSFVYERDEARRSNRITVVRKLED